MKNHFTSLCVLLLLGIQSLFAQYPTAVGTRWEFMQFHEDIEDIVHVVPAFTDEVVGDTVVAGQSYQIVRRVGQIYESYYTAAYYYDTLDGTYYTRVNNDEVRVLDLSLTHERLLYKFGLSLGDTLSEVPLNLLNLTAAGMSGDLSKFYDPDTNCLYFGLCPGTYALAQSSVSSQPCSTWATAYNIRFLDNIGTIYSEPFITLLDYYGQHYYLKRLTSGGNTLYVHPLFATDVDDNLVGPKIDIGPNPTTQYVKISSEQPIKSLRVINALGQELLMRDVNASSTNLDLNGLPKGLYWLRIQGQDHAVTRVVRLD